MRIRGYLAALMCMVAGAQAETPAPQFAQVKVQAGDDTAWSLPAFDDRDWREVYWTKVDPQRRLLWMRAHVSLPSGAAHAGNPARLRISLLASYEVYWNGVRIGANGSPAAARAGETPGLIDASFEIPPHLLRANDNLLALRMSAFHARRTLAAPMQQLSVELERKPRYGVPVGRLPIVAASGALLLGALYFGAMFASDRRDRPSLLLALLSLSVLGQLASEMARIFPYEYPLQILRLEAILGFATASGILLALYVLQRFGSRARRRVMGIALAVMLAGIAFVPGFDGKTVIAIMVPLIGALVVSATAAAARAPGARGMSIAIILVLASLLLAPERFLDETYYYVASAFLLFLFAQQAMTLRRAQSEREAAQLRSMRLELELLKRQIQPHFLMNTLTALSELIESDPPAGIRMIEALGAELRSLAAASGQSTIPMSTELELCRSHLQVMGFRKEQPFTLVTNDVNGEAPVPPGIFHTLIENAFTHNEYSNGATFALTETAGADGRRTYRLRSPLTGSAVSQADGQGNAYVRARLREAWGDDWSFTSGPVEGQWQAVIEMPRVQ